VTPRVWQALRLSAVFCSCCVASGCLAEDSGLPYTRLSISVAEQSGVGVSGFPACVTLPILNGSVVEERHNIDGDLAVEVFATSSAVELSFSGANPDANRAITAEQLRRGHAETMEIVNQGGSVFTVELSSTCADAGSG
jgi:hypothetical protein